MKKVLALVIIGTSFFVSAQEVIVDKKFEKENVPLDYDFLNKKDEIAIFEGKPNNSRNQKNTEIAKVTTFSSSGKSKVWFENESLMKVSFNFSGNVLVADKFDKNSWIGEAKKIYFNSNVSIFEKKFQGRHYFDDKVITNRDNPTDKNSKRLIINYSDKTSKEFLPNYKGYERIENENSYKSQRSLGVKEFVNQDGKIENISKFISKDCKHSTIYRTFYDSNGSLLDEISYEINLEGYSLILSVTNGGYMKEKPVIGYNTGFYNPNGVNYAKNHSAFVYEDFQDDGSINNIFFDEEQNAYVYGMMGKKDKSNLLINKIMGYYVFKFDKAGKLIWKKLFETDKFSDVGGNYLNNTYVRLFNLDNKIQFLCASTKPNEIVMFSEISQLEGNLLTTEFHKFEQHFSRDANYFITSNYTDKTNLKNKIIDFEALMLYYKNQKFKNYIDSIIPKNNIYFNTQIGKNGFWLIESDNKTYYKVLRF